MSFRDKDTEGLWKRQHRRRIPPDLSRPARRKLLILHSATSLNDLAAVPGSRIEKLSGDREGQHSIRVNDQWRICFVWKGADAYEVEICDYH